MALNERQELIVGVGVLSNGFWLADFGLSLTNMMTYCQSHSFPGYAKHQVQMISSKGSILPKQRREVVKIAQKQKCTHLLWVDSDHTFPPQMLHRLVNDRRDVVGVNHVTKCIPASPTARARPTTEHPYGAPVFTDQNSPEFEKVWRLGCGTMLVNMRVFERVGSDAIFDMFYNKEINDVQGEDWTMCSAFEKFEVDVWVDHKLSERCGHIGLMRFDHSMVGEIVREELDVGPSVARAA